MILAFLQHHDSIFASVVKATQHAKHMLNKQNAMTETLALVGEIENDFSFS